jgi:Flp pilus assembly protein TadG
MFLGFLVFATDFGRMYLIQGELQTAADAAALAAATQLVGTQSSSEHGNDQITASFDTTTGNDNRFNLRLSSISSSGGTGLVTTQSNDYFSTVADALANVNGGQTGGIDWGSGSYPKYVRVQITAQAPVLFLPIFNRSFTTLPTVTAKSVAGISAPICSACGIDGLAVADLSGGSDPANYGFIPGHFYTLYLLRAQRNNGAATPPAPIDGSQLAAYVVLNHIPNGPQGLDADATLYELAAGGLSNNPTLAIPGTVAVGSTETLYTAGTSLTVGPDILCGLNVRFAVDPSLTPNCSAVDGGLFPSLSSLFTADTDPGGAGGYAAGTGLQDFAIEYDGNVRRVLTVTVVDSTSTLSVLNFRQFLIDPAPPSATITQGLDTTLLTGAFRAQYLGAPVPIRCGGVGGICTITSGVGRTVLH